jgi:NADPH:quinone reductase-like Zn-dependent oxidoreductase
MKAIVYYWYGGPEVLRLEELAKPLPQAGEVLVRVRAAALNPYDWHFMRGTPYPLRLMLGMGKPKNSRIGADLAGEVEAVGKDVTQFNVGDAVFGGGQGAFAEYVCAGEAKLAHKPENATFEEAAGVNIAGLTALQALRDKARVRAGQSVLVNGAAGGVGTFGVQIAKAYGAEVTGVCSGRNTEMVRGIGAERVVDYAREDFAAGEARYDVVLDCVGNRSLTDVRRVLKEEGVYVGAGGTTDNWMMGPIADTFKRVWLSRFGKRKLLAIWAKPRREDLLDLAEMIKVGKVRTVLDRRYKLSETGEAMRYLELGHARGKVVVVPD